MRPLFASRAKTPLHTGVRTGCIFLFGVSLSVDFHEPGIYVGGRVWANAWDVFRRTPSRGGRDCRGAVDFVVCFGCGGILGGGCVVLISNAQGLLQV